MMGLWVTYVREQMSPYGAVAICSSVRLACVLYDVML